MNKLKTILVDDEPLSLSMLEEMLGKYCPSLVITGKASDAQQAAAIIEAQSPDVVFLDIEMPYGNAFDLLDKMAEIRFEIIFVTAYSNYAIKAFKYAATDYLLKPLNFEELQQAVNRIHIKVGERKLNERIAVLLENLNTKPDEAKKIMLPIADGFMVEQVQDILYLSAEGSYTRVNLVNDKKVLVSKNLKEFEDILPPHVFYRIHNSTIINTNYVKKFTRGRGGEVEMSDGEIFLVASRRKADFLEKMSK